MLIFIASQHDVFRHGRCPQESLFTVVTNMHVLDKEDSNMPGSALYFDRNTCPFEVAALSSHCKCHSVTDALINYFLR